MSDRSIPEEMVDAVAFHLWRRTTSPTPRAGAAGRVTWTALGRTKGGSELCGLYREEAGELLTAAKVPELLAELKEIREHMSQPEAMRFEMLREAIVEIDRKEGERRKTLALLWQIKMTAERSRVTDPPFVLPNQIIHLADCAMGKDRPLAQNLAAALAVPEERGEK